MGIETLYAIGNIKSCIRHNLLAIWVLKQDFVCFLQVLNGHNLLAIWVLKHLAKLRISSAMTTQPTRYMGIETIRHPI